MIVDDIENLLKNETTTGGEIAEAWIQAMREMTPKERAVLVQDLVNRVQGFPRRYERFFEANSIVLRTIEGKELVHSINQGVSNLPNKARVCRIAELSHRHLSSGTHELLDEWLRTFCIAPAPDARIRDSMIGLSRVVQFCQPMLREWYISANSRDPSVPEDIKSIQEWLHRADIGTACICPYGPIVHDLPVYTTSCDHQGASTDVKPYGDKVMVEVHFGERDGNG